jgi:hypothetical protein
MFFNIESDSTQFSSRAQEGSVDNKFDLFSSNLIAKSQNIDLPTMSMMMMIIMLQFMRRVARHEASVRLMTVDGEEFIPETTRVTPSKWIRNR